MSVRQNEEIHSRFIEQQFNNIKIKWPEHLRGREHLADEKAGGKYDEKSNRYDRHDSVNRDSQCRSVRSL